MAAKKKVKKKIAMLSAEDLVKGLRRNNNRLPTKASEARRKGLRRNNNRLPTKASEARRKRKLKKKKS